MGNAFWRIIEGESKGKGWKTVGRALQSVPTI
jgi:hypothetical protein